MTRWWRGRECTRPFPSREWLIGFGGMRTTVGLPLPCRSQYSRRPSAAIANPVSSGSRARMPLISSRPGFEHHVERRLGDAAEAGEAAGLDDVADARLARLG